MKFGLGGKAYLTVTSKDGKQKYKEDVSNLITDWGMGNAGLNYLPLCFQRAFLSTASWSTDTSLSHWTNDFGGLKTEMARQYTRPDGSGNPDTTYNNGGVYNTGTLLTSQALHDSNRREPTYTTRISEDPSGEVNPIITYWGYAMANRLGYITHSTSNNLYYVSSDYHTALRADIAIATANTGLKNYTGNYGLTADNTVKPWLQRCSFRYTAPGAATYTFIGFGKETADTDMFSRIPINGGTGISVVGGDIIDVRYEFKMNISPFNRETDYDPAQPYLGMEVGRNFPSVVPISDWGNALHGFHCLQYAHCGIDADGGLEGAFGNAYNIMSPGIGTNGEIVSIKLLQKPNQVTTVTGVLGTNMYSNANLTWPVIATGLATVGTAARVGATDTWRKQINITFGTDVNSSQVRAIGITAISNGTGNYPNAYFTYMYTYSADQTKPANKDLNLTLTVEWTRS